jgi:hypothetical protein
MISLPSSFISSAMLRRLLLIIWSSCIITVIIAEIMHSVKSAIVVEYLMRVIL